MIKQLFIILSLTANSLFQTACFAQPSQQWVVNYNGTANQLDYGRAIQVDKTGNAYIAGTVSNSGSGKDIAVVKYNSLGIQQWVATYKGAANSDDWAYCLAIDTAGNSFVAGFTNTSSSGKDFITVKFNSAGTFLWAMQYNGSGNLDDAANHIAIDTWGNVAVTGISKGNGTGDDYATVKYSASGSKLWATRYDGTAGAVDDARTIVADRNGNFYVSGGSTGIASDYDYTTIKYDSAGVQKWVARYNGPNNGYDLVYYQGSVKVDTLGNVYITGYSTGLDSTLDYATIKYDSLGTQLWVKRFSTQTGGTDYADAIHVDDSLNVYVTGGSYKTTNDYEFATLKYNSQGVQQWVAYYNGTGNSWDEAYGVLTDDSLNVYILGRSPGTTTSADFVILKYSPSGSKIWETRYANNGYDWPFNIRMSPDRSIYVGGWTSPANNMPDMTIIKYSQTPVGIENHVQNDIEFEVFPNPSTGKFNLNITSQDKVKGKQSYVEMYSSVGEKIFQSEIEIPKSLIDLSSLPDGIYFIRLVSGNTSTSKKVIIASNN